MNSLPKLPQLPTLGAPGGELYKPFKFTTPQQLISGYTAAPLGKAYGPQGSLLQPGQFRPMGGK